MKSGISKSLIVVVLFATFIGCEEQPKITTSSADALQAYNEGLRALNLFYYGDAIAAFERALKADTAFAMASAKLAHAYFNTENERDAQKEIVRSLALSSKATKEEQLFIRTLDHRIHFRNDAAVASLDSLIALSPKNAEAYTLRGNFFEMSKDYEAGLEMYKRAVQVDTNYALAVMSLGYAYSSFGDFDKAIEQMERYIRIAPDAADSRASFGDVLLRAGRYDDALAQYNESLKLKPDYWYAINKIGDVYSVLGRLNEADKQFDLGLSKTVMNNTIRGSHIATEGILQYQRGKYEEALRLSNEAFKLDSVNWKAAFLCLVPLMKLQKFDEAQVFLDNIRLELMRRNLSESSSMLEFHLLQARFYREQSILDEARAECDTAMEFGSELTRSAVFQELAEIHLKAGEHEEALDALEGALRYNANRPEALFTLTKVYLASGDRQLANNIGTRLLDLWSRADPDFQRLIELKKLLGKSVSHSEPVS